MPLDLDAAQFGSAAMPPSSGPVTTTLDGELYFGAMSHDGTLTTSAGPGFMKREVPADSSINVPLATEDMVGPAQTAAATFSLSTPASWACALVTFK